MMWDTQGSDVRVRVVRTGRGSRLVVIDGQGRGHEVTGLVTDEPDGKEGK